MKMYALYDTVTSKYATCLEFPKFGCSSDWADGPFGARLHKGTTSMKGAMTRLLRRLELNVKMLKAGDWSDVGRYHNVMKTWSIECEERQARNLANFGMVIVEVVDDSVSPRIV